MKRAIAVLLFAVVLLVCMEFGGCSGSGNSGGKPSGVAKRAFVSNDQDGLLHIINAALDSESGFFVSIGGRPHEMYVSSDHKFSLVHALSTNALFLVDNTKEQATGSIRLTDVTESFVLLPDNVTGFAAVRNANAVEALNFSSFTISNTITVPLARYLALNNGGSKLLAFSDGQDTVTVIDTAAKTASAPLGGFSRPVSAVFSSDDSTAYVMNCGPECGGAAADANGNTSVTVLNMNSNPVTITGNIIVPGATVGLLSGSTLYVAGSPPGAACGGGTAATNCGRLSIIDTGSTSVSSSNTVITDGYHNHMELGSNNLLFLGARTCTVITAENRGCLTLYDVTANSAAIAQDIVAGDVTGIAPIANRNTVYVVEAGELRVYDTTTGKPAAADHQIDIIGMAWDVKDID